MIQEWNSTVAFPRNDMQKTMATEMSEFDKGVFSEEAIQFSDPQVKKRFHEGLKREREKQTTELKYTSRHPIYLPYILSTSDNSDN